MKFQSVSIAFLSVLMLSVFIQFPVHAESSTLEVTGEGTVTPAPDQAELRLAVEKWIRFDDHPEAGRQELLRDLQADLEETTSRVRTALVELPYLQDENVHTVDVNIGTWSERKERDFRVVGWQGQHILQVRTGELNRVSEIISRAIESGVTRTHRLEFGLLEDTRREARNEALARAVRNARQSGRAMAEAAEVELGPIQLLQVTERPETHPYFRAAMLDVEEMASPAVHPPDTIELRAEVLMKFSLRQLE